MRNCGQYLKHYRLDFGLQEWMRHICKKSLQVMFDERHDDEYPVLSSNCDLLL